MGAAEDLRTAVAALTQPTKRAVMLDPDEAGVVATLRALVPSLLDQLAEAAEKGEQKGGIRSVPDSRPPTGLDVLDVRVEIVDGIAHRRHHLGLPPVDDPGAGLAGYAEELIRQVAMVSSPVTEDSLINLTFVAGVRWRRIAEQVLRIEYRARELHGMPCPAPGCHEKWHTPQPGEPRVAALFMVVGISGQPRAMECRCCGAVWWAGAVLDEVGSAYRAWQKAGEAGVRRRSA